MSSTPKIVVQFAVYAERQFWLKRRGNEEHYNHVTSVLSGIGAERARHTALQAIEEHNPDVLISAGFCGGLSPELKTGDVVTPSHIENSAGEQIRVDVCKSLRELSSETDTRLLTADTLLNSITRKQDAFQRTECDAVDMESFAVAKVCAEHGVRFLSLRVVFDDRGFCIPTEITDTLDEYGNPSWWKTLWEGIPRPTFISDIMQMANMTRRAGDSLADTLGMAILLLHEDPTLFRIERS